MTIATPSKKTTTQNDLGLVVESAFAKIAPVWPLDRFTACSPLQGLECSFEEAMNWGAAHFQGSPPPEILAVNRETIKWCGAFFDRGQATLAMPGRHLGLYRCWKDLVRHDTSLKGEWIRQLPATAEEALALSCERLAIAPDERESFFTRLLTTLPGWSGYVKYCAQWRVEEPEGQSLLLAYLAVRMALLACLWPAAGEEFLEPVSSGVDSQLEQLEKAEAKFGDWLVGRLSPSPEKGELEAQFVFCIDTRSEPFRRALEGQGSYETFGFAGFFGVPVAISGEEGQAPSCPVLLKPQHCMRLVSQRSWPWKLWRRMQALYAPLKYTFSTPFVLADFLGFWSALVSLPRTFFPGLFSMGRPATCAIPDEIPLSDQCDRAEGALRMMGLTDRFAPLVVFCGHGSRSTNNPHAASLHCGACGGQAGGPNADLLAAMCNNEQVRAELGRRGIAIPSTTHFASAEHNTGTDELVFRGDFVPSAGLREHLHKARGEKVKRRGLDWAETRPEWGLARNGGFVVGPRSLTSGSDLEGRVFLHSYDWSRDNSGDFLEAILTAPVVVAQWINHQYLFSTLNPQAYSSGSKVTSNLVGKIGVMQGNGSDLMHGLPLQSIYSGDDEPYHESMRLTVAVYASRELIDSVVQRNETVQHLFSQGLAHLLVLDPTDNSTYRLQRDLSWKLLFGERDPFRLRIDT